MRAETTLRLELLKYYENLYPDSSGFRDTDGWKCHFAKNYIQSITRKDIRWFVTTTLKRMKINSRFLDSKTVDYIVNEVYNKYRYTIDDERIAFILKSRTEMNRDDDRKNIVIRFLSALWHGFKKRYNGALETFKID